jgi:hypothetical protein
VGHEEPVRTLQSCKTASNMSEYGSAYRTAVSATIEDSKQSEGTAKIQCRKRTMQLENHASEVVCDFL